MNRARIQKTAAPSVLGCAAVVLAAGEGFLLMMKVSIALLSVGLAAAGWLQFAAGPAVVFENIQPSSGVKFVLDNSATPEKHQPETMIAGVAVFDYNNDGLPDLYFVNGASMPGLDKSDPKLLEPSLPQQRRRHLHGRHREGRREGRGYGMGVAAGDYDNDGCEDLYIAGVNRNQLLHNNCDGTFTDVTEKAGVAGMSRHRERFGDQRGLVRLRQRRPAGPVRLQLRSTGSRARSRLLHGGPAGPTARRTPTKASRTCCSTTTATARLPTFRRNRASAEHIGKGMGVAFADYDGDGFTDIFVSNDTYRNFLFHNRATGPSRRRASWPASPITRTETRSPAWARTSAIWTTTAGRTSSSLA